MYCKQITKSSLCFLCRLKNSKIKKCYVGYQQSYILMDISTNILNNKIYK